METTTIANGLYTQIVCSTHSEITPYIKEVDINVCSNTMVMVIHEPVEDSLLDIIRSMGLININIEKSLDSKIEIGAMLLDHKLEFKLGSETPIVHTLKFVML